MDINQVIKERRSIFPKEFTGASIDDSIIEQLLHNAHWAPSHRLTLAWQFRVYKAKAKDQLFDYWIANGPKEKKEKLLFNKSKTSHVILISYQDKGINPIIEEIASTACAVQNIHLSLSQFPNVGGYWGSGNGIYSPEFAKHINMLKNEHCMGYFLLGQVKSKRTESTRSEIENNTIWVKPED